MNKDRLLKLAEFLDELPEYMLDMSRWTKDCGTASCALGWACTIPEFRAEGLTLDRFDTPSFDGDCGYGAAVHFFDLHRDQALELFSPTYYGSGSWHQKIKPCEVAARIRGLVAS